MKRSPLTRQGKAGVSPFETAYNAFKASLGPNYTGVVSQHTLRAEVELSDATGRYDLDFRQAKGIKQLTEELLKENDRFRVLGFRALIGVRDSVNPTAYVKQTYPNKTVFEAEAGLATPGTFDPDHLEALYNAGSLQYRKGDTVYMPACKLWPARFVGQTQQSSAANKSSTETAFAGMIPAVRPFDLVGTDLGEMTLNIPGSQNLKIQYTPAATGHATKKVIFILELEGILASGGNKIQTGAGSEVI